MIICPISKELSDKLVKKYSFLKSINLRCTEKDNKSVYIEPTIVVETTPLPKPFYDLKYEIYSLVNQETNRMPHLRNGWKIIAEE